MVESTSSLPLLGVATGQFPGVRRRQREREVLREQPALHLQPVEPLLDQAHLAQTGEWLHAAPLGAHHHLGKLRAPLQQRREHGAVHPVQVGSDRRALQRPGPPLQAQGQAEAETEQLLGISFAQAAPGIFAVTAGQSIRGPG